MLILVDQTPKGMGHLGFYKRRILRENVRKQAFDEEEKLDSKKKKDNTLTKAVNGRTKKVI